MGLYGSLPTIKDLTIDGKCFFIVFVSVGCVLHQTWHLCLGFMLDPRGQLKSLANSAMFENGPWTLNMSGEWTPVRTRILRALGRYFAHQTFAALTQNSCLWPKDNPVIKIRWGFSCDYDIIKLPPTMYLFKNWAISGLFIVYFRYFSSKHQHNFTTN